MRRVSPPSPFLPIGAFLRSKSRDLAPPHAERLLLAQARPVMSLQAKRQRTERWRFLKRGEAPVSLCKANMPGDWDLRVWVEYYDGDPEDCPRYRIQWTLPQSG